MKNSNIFSANKTDIPWKTHFKGAFISGVFVFLVLYLFSLLEGADKNWPSAYYLFGITMIYNVSIYMSNIVFAVYISDKIEQWFFKSFSMVSKFVIGIFLSLVITTMTVVLLDVVFGALLWNLSPLRAITYFGWRFWLIYWGISVIIALFVHGIEMVKQLQASEQREKQLLRDYHDARYQAIKGQLNPHFLFNSLSVLSALIEESPEKAQKFVQGLSRTYRYVLEHHKQDWVPLKIELDFARDYLHLLKMRFESGLDYRIDIDESALSNAKIIPLSLQILLENAVKHNVIQTGKPIHIQISYRDDHIIVTNSLQPIKDQKNSTNIGLKNIRSRYKSLTGRDIILSKENGYFIVKLPLG